VNRLAELLRGLSVPEAVAAAGAGMAMVGVAVTVDALIEAARSTTTASLLAWQQRLALGLWEFRVEHTLWFTAGLLALWWGLSHGAALGGWSGHLGRLAGGLAVGYALVAVAVVVGSTVVALAGGIGSGIARVQFSERERILTWLLQATTAAAAGAVWGLLAARIPEDSGWAKPEEVWDEEANAGWAAAETGAGGEDDETVALLPPASSIMPMAPPPPADQPALEVLPQPTPGASTPPRPAAEAADPATQTPAQRAQRIFEERLAFSPRRDEARRLLDRVREAERSGRAEQAEELADRLADL
jgi:hypothetical protein